MPMKILFLNYEYPPLGGGAGVAMQYLLKGFSQTKEFSADLITSSIDSSRIEHVSDNISIHHLDIGKQGSFHYQTNKDLLTYSAKAYFYAQKLISHNTYHLVHAFFGIPCGVVASKLHLPFIVSLRGSDVPFYNQRFATMDKYLFKHLSKRLWKNAAAVVANSKGLRDLALESSPEQEISIIPNGVDTEFFSSKKDGQVNGDITLVSTGRLIERKGYQFIIEALNGLSNFELQLVGDGNMHDELKALAHENGVNVRFLGKKDRDAIPSILKNADIFVLPSLNEGMSNSLLEAISCGLPVIVTDVGGSSEIVRDNGFIVPKASVDALRNALIKYKHTPSLIAEHGKASRDIALSMSSQHMSNQYLALYKKHMIRE